MTVKSKRRTTDPARTDLLLAALRDIHEHPEDEARRLILADLLDEWGATPVQLHHLPNWLRLAWIRHAPEGARRKGYWGRSRTDGCSVSQDIARWYADSSWLDHWGSSTIAGLPCFVNEPYRDIEAGLFLFRDLARDVGGVDCYARVSAWGYGTRRFLLFPADQV